MTTPQLYYTGQVGPATGSEPRNRASNHLHAVEELFVHDLAASDSVDSDLFHREPSALWLKGDVQFENHRKMRTGDERTFDSGRVDFVVGGPPFALGFDGLKALSFARSSG